MYHAHFSAIQFLSSKEDNSFKFLKDMKIFIREIIWLSDITYFFSPSSLYSTTCPWILVSTVSPHYGACFVKFIQMQRQNMKTKPLWTKNLNSKWPPLLMLHGRPYSVSCSCVPLVATWWFFGSCWVSFLNRNRIRDTGMVSHPSKSPPAQKHFTTFWNFHWIQTYFLFKRHRHITNRS